MTAAFLDGLGRSVQVDVKFGPAWQATGDYRRSAKTEIGLVSLVLVEVMPGLPSRFQNPLPLSDEGLHFPRTSNTAFTKGRESLGFLIIQFDVIDMNPFLLAKKSSMTESETGNRSLRSRAPWRAMISSQMISDHQAQR